MIAIVTGASSGIGQDIAKELAKRNFDLVLVSRNKEKLNEFAKTLNVKTKVIPLDLSIKENCYKLHEMLKDKKISVLVNNAGFGDFGRFSDSDLKTDLNMIDLNICCVHILTKLFLKDFLKNDHGFILNVSSSAGFMPGGPLMATYYATKSYILSLSLAIYEEIRKFKSKVSISVLCPGPVKTKFNDRAGVNFSIEPLSSKEVAKISVEKMFKKQLLIIPGMMMKLSYIFSKLLPIKQQLMSIYHIQHKKRY